MCHVDIYCQGVQLVGDDKNLDDYEIEQDDNLVIVSKIQLPNESAMETSAGKIRMHIQWVSYWLNDL